MSLEKHKSGFVSIVGNPNVGKSTLMNSLVGKELSIITAKAQTTRHRILGIINGDDFQMVLSDTPGVIKPAYEMQNSMMKFVKESLDDADILIYITSVDEPEMKDDAIFEKIKNASAPLIVLINKIDQIDQDKLETKVDHWSLILPKAKIYPISALTGFFVDELLKILISELPESPPYFPKDQLTDKPERFFVNEAVRKCILENYNKEIPYSVEVVTEDFHEDKKIIRIRSVILVERETQKGILIGHKGTALKRVGVGARRKLQKFFGKQIHIELYVKVSKNWRSNTKELKRFGYND
jgi:GTP-binding protein Era